MTADLMTLGAHWIIAPVLLPLVAGAVLVLVGQRSERIAAGLSLGSVLAQLAAAVGLMAHAAGGQVEAYLLGNWAAPFGIALALDRLSALMLVLTALVALASVLYARGGDARRGLHFHALFQFQLMGLNGAFLTADLFNLFVFFEVLLICSYGLLLHGLGAARLRASIHYVGFNLVGSALFLIAVAMLYGLTGTLNMADLALRLPRLTGDDMQLAHSAALLLLVVFGVKAALLPLYFWLPDTYGAATAPVAALFAIMTKVGVYAIARMTTLAFGDAGGAIAQVATPWLPVLAMGTLALSALGALASRWLHRLVAYLVIASAGTLLLAVGLGTRATVGAALFYLAHSTLVAAALFLLVDAVGSARGTARDRLRPSPLAHGRVAYGLLYFVFAVAATGMPPLAGFMGKALLLDGARATPMFVAVWVSVLVSALGIVIAMVRAGTTLFWAAPVGADASERRAPTSPAQWAALGVLTCALVAQAVWAGPLAAYARAAADQLFERRTYIEAVLGARPVPPRWHPRAGEKP